MCKMKLLSYLLMMKSPHYKNALEIQVQEQFVSNTTAWTYTVNLTKFLLVFLF